MTCLILTILLLALSVNCAHTHFYENVNANLRSSCPNVYQKTFRGYVPRGNLTAGTFAKVYDVSVLKQCVIKCCLKEKCNVAFMADDQCYHLACVSNELCAPTLSLNPESFENVSMVLVRPVGDGSWADVIKEKIQNDDEPSVDREMFSLLNDPLRLEAAYNNILEIGESSYDYSIGCDVGIPATCMRNEDCIQNYPKSRAGTCRCKQDFIRNLDGVCILSMEMKDKAINKPPQIVITPAKQTIKLPKTEAVLDASSSTDDNEIVSWHWELQQGPLGYEPQLKDTPTLQLNDLTLPGTYTFKLTITDSHKATNSSIATVTVLKIIDYPPEANAGPDVIVYLPNNQITLSGNLSGDDHNIISWKWTQAAGFADKFVDMQNTRTPYLLLSYLEEGMYSFVLTVTDSANQSSSAEVHVFVKPPINQPPVVLSQTWTVLSASKSKDDKEIEIFKWEQVDGPSTAIFSNVNLGITNVTGLTRGQYLFKLYVTDDNKNVS